MKQILCISDTPWHGLPCRTVQLLSRMKNHRILFIDPSAARTADSPAVRRSWKDEGEQVSKNITRLTAPPRSRFMAKSRAANRRYYQKMASWLKKRLAEYAMEKPVLWLTEPSAADLPGRLPHGAVIYDCREPFTDCQDGPGRMRLEMARELAAAAKVVFVPSEGLRRTLTALNPNTVMVSNGVDFELFQRARDDSLAFPNDLFTVQNPIFGHIGAVNEQLELSFVEKAASEHPEWSFIFVGEIVPGTVSAKLKELKNVRFLGVKPQKQLPLYLCRFNVCVSLYKTGEMYRDISPMKLYEYLASGKPVVSTPQPAQVLDFADVVYISGTAEEWVENCRKALLERDAWKVRQRAAFAKASGWEARVVEIERALLEKEVFE